MNILDKYEVINYTAGSKDKYLRGKKYTYDTIVHYQNGKIHRDDDLPAVISQNGEKKWYYHGLLHRENDLPAITEANGSKYWYYNGKRHRKTLDEQGYQLPSMIKYSKLDNDEPMIKVSWYINGMFNNLTPDEEGKRYYSIDSTGSKIWNVHENENENENENEDETDIYGVHTVDGCENIDMSDRVCPEIRQFLKGFMENNFRQLKAKYDP